MGMNAPKVIRLLNEAAFDKADMDRRMKNLRARRGEDDPVMKALDRGELSDWAEDKPKFYSPFEDSAGFHDSIA